MATYKVPQDVEADDKLLGPFSPRQVLYLGIAFGGIALTVGAFSLSSIIGIVLAIPLVPASLFVLVLALPLRKDQPTETYILALINFRLKPQKRYWNPGQRETTIVITAPRKENSGPQIRDLSSDEAENRLSFLADVVDSEGQSIRGNWSSPVRQDVMDEASDIPDMFDTYNSQLLGEHVSLETSTAREKVVSAMRAQIEMNSSLATANLPSMPTTSFPTPPQSTPVASAPSTPQVPPQAPQASPAPQPTPASPAPQPAPAYTPAIPTRTQITSQTGYQYSNTTLKAGNFTPVTPTPSTFIPTVNPVTPEPAQPSYNPAQRAALEQLSQNSDYSIATIAKEANRIEQDGEIYIALH